MLTTTIGIGMLIMLLSMLALAVVILWYALNNPRTRIGEWLYRWWPFGTPTAVQQREEQHAQQVKADLEEALRPVRIVDLLLNARTGQAFHTVPERRLVIISGLGVLQTLRSFGGSRDKVHFTPEGDELPNYPFFFLNNGQFIVHIPLREMGKVEWLRGVNIAYQSQVALAEFMAGANGPAKRFAQSNQSLGITFEIPGVDGEWECRDIIWANIKSEGESALPDGSMVSMLLSIRATDPSVYLLFINQRSGFSPIGDSLWLLEPLNPEIEFEQL